MTEADITRDLLGLGVRPGDILYVHSSMSSIGRVSGGANAIIDAILNVLGPTGTLVMPAFSMPPGGGMLTALKRAEVFDPKATPCTLGAIPETFRRRQGVLRSIHPTSSICALGARAHDITSSKPSASRTNFGIGTPLYKVMEYGGRVLGLGVSIAYVSIYHVLEDVMGDRFPVKIHLDQVYAARVLDDDRLVTMKVRPLDPMVSKTRIDQPNSVWLRSFFTDLLTDRGILKIGYVGNARSWLMNSIELFEALVELARKKVTIYTTEQEYRAKRLRLISYVSGYRSAFSDRRHNYLEEQVLQVAKGHESKGFWDSSSKNWIRQLNWNGSDWIGHVPHDWKYALELQEGAAQYALLTGHKTLDDHLKNEFEFIHSNLHGSASGISDRRAPMEYEYGAALSGLALGYKYFSRKNRTLAMQILYDADLLYRFMQTNFNPTFDDPFSIVLRAYANLHPVYESVKRPEETQKLRRQITAYADKFLRHQARDGLFPFDSAYGSETSVHMQLKVDLALLIAHRFTVEERYLLSAARNFEWVIKNLLQANGALKWDLDNEADFFEIHQMLALIVCSYLMMFLEGRIDYMKIAHQIWKFLLETNSSRSDMYVQNQRSTGAFSCFRYVDGLGNVQNGPHGSFKGAYEIGYSLWALALNRNLAL